MDSLVYLFRFVFIQSKVIKVNIKDIFRALSNIYDQFFYESN